MAFVSITRLRLRSLRFLPSFVLYTIRLRRQIGRAEGFQDGALIADGRTTFWTMTAWDSPEAMKHYITSGAHLKAMPRLAGWCEEASVVNWQQTGGVLPSWDEACRRMRESGRPSRLRHPSPLHATMAFRPPPAAGGLRLSPHTMP